MSIHSIEACNYLDISRYRKTYRGKDNQFIYLDNIIVNYLYTKEYLIV